MVFLRMLQPSAELHWQMSVITSEKQYMRKALKYIKNLAEKKKREDDFFAKIDRSRQHAMEGKAHEMLHDETFDEFIKRVECTK